jgi:alkylation response protein AidB-like acyl-CoA dehydrogenase
VLAQPLRLPAQRAELVHDARIGLADGREPVERREQRAGVASVRVRAPELVEAADAIHQCLLLHGHQGYSRRLPIEHRLRDVLAWQIGDGTPQIRKLIVARSLLGKGAAVR